MLVPIPPTRDTSMLDALARLLRTCMLTGKRVGELVADHGDPMMRQLYAAGSFPPFVYLGFDSDSEWLARLPPALRRAVGPADC